MRFVVRLLGALALAVALVLAVLDATRSVAVDGLVLTPLSTSWAETWPGGFGSTREWIVAKLGGGFWEGVAAPLLELPGFVLFGGVALILLALGRRRAEQSFGGAASPRT